MDTQLKPCPFCGDSNIFIDSTERGDRTECKWTAKVFCANCFGEVTNHGFDWTKEEAEQKAINAWNRRVAKDTDVLSKKLVYCKDCKFFMADVWYKGIIGAHNGCNRWGDGCATSPDGYCFLGVKKNE